MENQKSTQKDKNQFHFPDIDVFKTLTTEEMIFLKKSTLKKKAKQSEVLYSCKKKNLFIYFLLEGNVKLGKYYFKSKKVVSDIIFPWNFFDFNFFAIQRKNSNQEYAEALTEVTYLQISLDMIRTLMQSNKEFLAEIMSHFFRYHKRVETRLLLIKENTKVKEKVVKLLNQIETDYGEKIGDDSQIGLTPQDMADLLFTSVPIFLKAFNELEEEKLIRFNPF